MAVAEIVTSALIFGGLFALPACIDAAVYDKDQRTRRETRDPELAQKISSQTETEPKPQKKERRGSGFQCCHRIKGKRSRKSRAESIKTHTVA